MHKKSNRCAKIPNHKQKKIYFSLILQLWKQCKPTAAT